jgi:exosortase A-associated hydrolase 2
MSLKLTQTEHFFFGPQARSLFGAYHAPSQDSGFRCGILLCYPFGFEYIRAHRAFRQLAIRLANRGFGVLRFDFSGTGDSSGDFENVRLQHWMEDVCIASEKLKRISGVKKICIIGLRLGASIAAMSAKDLPNVDGLVLWEPVIRGEAYLQQIAVENAKYTSQEWGIPLKDERSPDDEYPTEILGFSMPISLFQDLRHLDLLTGSVFLRQVHLVSSADSPEVQAYRRKLSKGNGNVTLDVTDDQKLWLAEPYRALVPVRTINGIINRIAVRVG